MCRRSFSSKPKVQSLSSSRFIQKKCKSTLNNISASTHLKRKYKKTIKNEPVITKKRQRNQMVLNENCSSDLSILNLLTMIGEQGQSNFEMNNKNLHKYTDREVLKISNSWSKSISSEESEISLEVDNQDNATDILIKSLSPDCAYLEVEAMSLLAVLEHEADEQDIMDLSYCTSEDMYDDEAEDEIMRLNEVEESLSMELSRIDELENLIHMDTKNDVDFIISNEYGMLETRIEKEMHVTIAAACA
jgi:hypothetical protein